MMSDEPTTQRNPYSDIARRSVTTPIMCCLAVFGNGPVCRRATGA
jgi:hypothetical protein